MKKKAIVLSSYEFLNQFNTEFKCLKFLEKNLWKNGVKCGWCGSKEVSGKNKKTGFRRCRSCRKEFNVRTGTIFHKSKLPLTKWLYAVYLTQTGRKGISSMELSKKLGITQKTAWFMWHRIREACKSQSGMFSGSVSSDETYFGGEAKNKHAKDKPKKSGLTDKTMVQGIKSERQMKFHIIESNNKKTLQGNIKQSVKPGSTIVTDELKGYKGLNKTFHHISIKHSHGQYVCEASGATTNDLESVWGLMKRGYKGIYHHWSKKHLHRYLDEFSFRLDKGNCNIDTIDRVRSLVKGSDGKRITYEDLTS